MRPVKAKIKRSLPIGTTMQTCDNSGAKIIRLVSVKGLKTVKKRPQSAGVGDLVMVSVIKGLKEIRKQLVPAVIVRQKKEYSRPDGTRIKFSDNSVVILKDEKGNPKGTIFKGPIAKEAAERWPGISKIANIVV